MSESFEIALLAMEILKFKKGLCRPWFSGEDMYCRVSANATRDMMSAVVHAKELLKIAKKNVK